MADAKFLLTHTNIPPSSFSPEFQKILAEKRHGTVVGTLALSDGILPMTLFNSKKLVNLQIEAQDLYGTKMALGLENPSAERTVLLSHNYEARLKKAKVESEAFPKVQVNGEPSDQPTDLNSEKMNTLL